MGNSSFCQCNNYCNKNSFGIMKKSDVSFNDNKQKIINNNLLKFENNTNINTNDLHKVQESYDAMSKLNKSSKDNSNNINNSKNNLLIENFENQEIKNNELNDVFDNIMLSYADYISDNAFEKAIIPEIIEIDKKLKPINKDNYKIKQLINEKTIERPALLFKNNNAIYKGMWNKNGEKEGFGIFIDKEGNKYTGGWKDDKFNGYGRLVSKNGDYYEGEWLNGVIEGNGKFYNKKEEYTYIGNFKNNKFDGKGKIAYNNKIVYEGHFENGYKEGKGKLMFEDGSYYEGQFENNNYFEGKFKFKDGRHYNGEWDNNNMEGEGKFTWDKNVYYKGEYKNNMRNGKGVYHFSKRNKLDGMWKNDLPHGEGVITYDDKKIEGEFRYGKLIKGQNGQDEISSPKKKRKGRKSVNNENMNFPSSKIKNKDYSKSDKNIAKK